MAITKGTRVMLSMRIGYNTVAVLLPKEVNADSIRQIIKGVSVTKKSYGDESLHYDERGANITIRVIDEDHISYDHDTTKHDDDDECRPCRIIIDSIKEKLQGNTNKCVKYEDDRIVVSDGKRPGVVFEFGDISSPEFDPEEFIGNVIKEAKSK